MSSQFRIVEHTLKCAHTREYPAATANGDDDRLQLAVKQYIPLKNPHPQKGDVTIIGAHANGFPKELYEPLWDDLHEISSENGFKIRSIWIADMWNQGQSGVANEKMLGNDPSWFDHSRDLMNLINQKQDEMPHPLVGIGHSMGAMQLTHLALSHPRLFHSLVLLDPVIQRSNGSISPAILSTRRRDIWPSRKTAAEKFRNSPFYQAWDSRVLERWIRYGLRDVPTELFPEESANDTRVTLTTSKHQELFTFLRPTYRGDSTERFLDLDPEVRNEHSDYPFYRPEPPHVFDRLPELRPSTLYVFGNKSELSPPHEREAKMRTTGVGVGGSGGVRAGRVKQTVLDCGHLVAMERVKQCATEAADFLGQEMVRYRKERDSFMEYWMSQSREQKTKIDQRWCEEIEPKDHRSKRKEVKDSNL